MSRKRRRSRRFPELELRTGAWVIHMWANKTARLDNSDHTSFDADSKATALEKAILKGAVKGRIPDIPVEVLKDEYRGTLESVKALHQSIRRETVERGIELLRRSFLTYGPIDGQNGFLRRPAWLTSEDPRREVQGINTRTLSATTFGQILVGQLFGYSERSVREGVVIRRTYRGDASGAAQQYLAAMFLIGTMKNDVEKPVLVEILEALRDSGYSPLRLYHLSRMASQNKRILRPELVYPKGDIIKALRLIRGGAPRNRLS